MKKLLLDKRAKMLLLGVKFEPLPDYGDLFTLKEFEQDCKSGMLIDYDGTGYYAFKDEMSDKPANPSYFKAGDIDRDFTHVMWFNK
jgi:hypothetical protein